jgi:hypothetical protein
MSKIGDLWFALRGDDKTLQVDVKKAGAKAGDSFGAQFKKSWSGQNIGKGLVQGLGLAGGLGAANLLGNALGAVQDLIGDSITAASDLNETMSKSQVVFGRASSTISKWGDTTAKAIGISKQAAIEAAATFGNFFVGLGKGQSEAADMSKNVVNLAGDLASFNNLDPTDVLDKLRAGLAGEAEPLRRLGVFLTEAKVKAKAMALGLADANGEVSEGAKVTARYHLILEETTTAQGDFARTADGLANSQRTANAVLKDTEAQLGQKLLPAQLAATQAQIDLIEGVGRLEGGLSDAGANLDGFIGQLGDLVGVESGLTERSAQHWALIASNVERATDDSTTSVESMRGAMVTDSKATGKALEGVGKSAGKMEETVTHHADGTAKSIDEMKDDIVDDARELIDDAFDPIIAHDKLIATNAEIAAAKRVIASGKASKAEIADAKATLHSAQKDQAELVLTLARAGQTGSKAYKQGVAALRESVKNATGPTKVYLQGVLDKILAIEKAGKVVPINIVYSHSVSDGGPPRRAAGAPQQANQPYWVGERGPELHVPATNGRILTTAQSMAAVAGGTGGGATINVQLPVSARPDPFETASALRRLNDFGVLG